MRIGVFQENVFKEYKLPNIENIDYAVVLDKNIFGLSKDKKIEFENTDGCWFVKECKGLLDGERNPVKAKSQLADMQRFVLDLAGGIINIICCADSDSFYPLKKYIANGRIDVGSSSGCAVNYRCSNFIREIHFSLSCSGTQIYLRNSQGLVAVNGMIVRGDTLLSYGDEIRLFGLIIIFLGSVLAVGSVYGELSVNEQRLQKAGTPPKVAVREAQETKLFNRAPRTTGHIFDEQIDIEMPSGMQSSKKTPIMQTIGPSFTMALPMIIGCLIAAFSSGKGGSSTFMYTGIITALGSALIGAFWAVKNIRYARENEYEMERKRFKVYSEYLVKTADEISHKYANNYNILHSIYPSAQDVCSYNSSSVELWNRNVFHKDFLSHRLGLGERPFQCEINTSKVKFSLSYDSLQNKPALIKDQFSTMYNVPVCIDILKENLYGIVGSAAKDSALNVMYALAAQIAAGNCYTDVKLVFIYDAKGGVRADKWDFFRYLPHVYSENRKIRYIADDKTAAADVFFELANVIRKRLDEQQNSKKETWLPHYVVFIEDYKLLEGEPIARYLLTQHNNYGFTTFILSSDYYKLPNNCENIIQNDEYGTFVYNALDTEKERQKFVLDSVDPLQLEAFAKRIADIKVSQIENDSEIPSSLSFMEMYGITKLEELKITERWRKNRTYNTMKALIGKKAGGVDCYLDIHEKYHGPHGLVAGTTGSGKSETLQTYILSLAVNFSPDDVAFLIIDFKGGGMANLFDGLPHMAGTISNLSGNQITRAMVSIKSEIRRRQVMFSANSVNNINAYTNLFKAKEISEPIPHLLIIIDEFAEMKREEPEFMKELISVAQVGRSLGIHLILATQKPSGTVDDNIWSNTKFRLCLRVQSRGDSMDMLHKPDAAYLSQAGRCYLQVGSDEIFELFQSGWSGADFDESGDMTDTTSASMITLNGKAAIIGNRAKIKKSEEKKQRWVNCLCLSYLQTLTEKGGVPAKMDSDKKHEFILHIINKLKSAGFKYGDSETDIRALEDFYKMYEENYSVDLVEENVLSIIGKGMKIPEAKEVSQLDAIVDYLGTVATKNGYESKLKLWLPPLGEEIYLSQIEGFLNYSYENRKWGGLENKFTLSAVAGLCDDPENQMQMPFEVDFAKDGHCAVIGSIVSGKSTFMQTLLYSLISKYSPERLNIYIIDFSSSSLAPFEAAPHCGGFINEKNIDAVGKLLNMLNKLIEERKNLFDGGSYSQYVNAYGVNIPAVIFAIDNYAGFSEKTEGKFEQTIIRMSREAAGYGIFLFLSAQGFGMNEIPGRIADNIGRVVTISLGDKFKYMDVLRTSSISLVPEAGVKGRGLVLYDERLLEFQTAISVRAEDDYARLEKLRSIFKAMDKGYDGQKARKIPHIPEDPVYSSFAAESDVIDAAARSELIPVAYRLSDASIHCINLSGLYCYTISGKRRTGKTNVLKLILEGVRNKNGRIAVFESSSEELKGITAEVGGEYLTNAAELSGFFSDLLPEFSKRNKQKKIYVAQSMNDIEIYEKMASYPPIFIFINDMVNFFKFIYEPGEGVVNARGFVENIMEKGMLHNVYFFGCVDTEKGYELSSYKAYADFVKYKKGVHLGGAVSSQQIFSFQNIPFNETSKALKRGIGLTPDDEDETQALRIVLPLAGR